MFRVLMVPLFLYPVLLALITGQNASTVDETSQMQGTQSMGGDTARDSETYPAANVNKTHCPRGFTKKAMRCYFLGTNKVTWYEALTICQFVVPNAYLAEIHTPDDQHVLLGLIKIEGVAGEYWVGAVNFTQVEYRWYKSGAPVNEKFWDTNETNNAGDSERCAELRHNGRLNDNDCHARRNYICTIPVC